MYETVSRLLQNLSWEIPLSFSHVGSSCVETPQNELQKRIIATQLQAFQHQHLAAWGERTHTLALDTGNRRTARIMASDSAMCAQFKGFFEQTEAPAHSLGKEYVSGMFSSSEPNGNILQLRKQSLDTSCWRTADIVLHSSNHKLYHHCIPNTATMISLQPCCRATSTTIPCLSCFTGEPTVTRTPKNARLPKLAHDWCKDLGARQHCRH